jgi:predicted lipoprotein with Yx(FWY)xxD motif
MTMRTRTAAVLGVAVFALAACSNGEGSAGGDQEAGGGSAGATGATVAMVRVARGDLGPMLVDADGRTLYVFLADTGSTSTCYGECAANWPALVSSGRPAAADGIDPSMIGTTVRTDGSKQVTFDGRPLYVFGGDAAAGDTNGQGIGGVWFVVSPRGTPIEDAAGSHGDDAGQDDSGGSRGSGY